MSSEYQYGVDDVAIVLTAHNIPFNKEQLNQFFDELDCDEIDNSVMSYTSFEAQTDALFHEIEDQLMESGDIPKGEKKFVMQDEYAEDEEDDFDDEWDEAYTAIEPCKDDEDDDE